MIDYAKLDASKPWNYHADKLKQAKAMGCTHITEMYHKAYISAGGHKPASKMLGVSESHMLKVLHYIGIELKPVGRQLTTNRAQEWALRRLYHEISNSRRTN